MYTILGTSSLTAAVLTEPLLSGTLELTLLGVMAGGSALIVRRAARMFGASAEADTFTAYRAARLSARGTGLAV